MVNYCLRIGGYALRAGVALGAVSVSSAAMAGGVPIPSVPVVAPAPVPVPLDRFSGSYVGSSIGWAFNGDDRVGLSQDDGVPTNVGDLQNEGFIGGIHAGYRFTYNSLVFGAELGLDGSDVGDSDSVGGVDSETSLNYLATAKGQLGYLATPSTLVYGTAGVAHGEVDYAVVGDGADIDETFTRTGYVVGGGVEYAWDERWSVRGEYNYTNLGKERLVDETGLGTSATPDFHSVRLGVNFRF